MSLFHISDNTVQNMPDLKIIHLSEHNAIPLPKQNFRYSLQITTFFPLLMKYLVILSWSIFVE